MKKRWTVVVARPLPRNAKEAATYVAYVDATTVDDAITVGRLEAFNSSKVSSKQVTKLADWKVLCVFIGHQTLEYQL